MNNWAPTTAIWVEWGRLRPLATVVVGGMLVGPLIMLVVVPALQTLFLTREGGAGRAPEGEAASAPLDA